MTFTINNNILVSVIIPCYNVSEYIQECVNSVINQTYNSIEIICIDDGSNDDTLLILKEMEFLNEISLYRQENCGAPSARNLGLKHAKGEWIQFLDADDLLKPNKIQHQIEILKNNFNVDVIYGSSIKRKIHSSEKMSIIKNDIILGLLKTQLGNTCSNFFRKSKIIEIGGWNENMKSSQEYDLMIRLFKANSLFHCDNEYLTIIRERKSGQISALKSKWVTNLNLRLDFYNYLIIENYSIKNEYLEAIFNVMLLCAIYNKNELLFVMKKNYNFLKKLDKLQFLKLFFNILFKYP